MAEWQTQRTQNPPGATPCEFDSRLGHERVACFTEGGAVPGARERPGTTTHFPRYAVSSAITPGHRLRYSSRTAVFLPKPPWRTWSLVPAARQRPPTQRSTSRRLQAPAVSPCHQASSSFASVNARNTRSGGAVMSSSGSMVSDAESAGAVTEAGDLAISCAQGWASTWRLSRASRAGQKRRYSSSQRST